jgi:Flp pilus assembly pilin Flp
VRPDSAGARGGAQSAIEYGLLIATVALLALLGGAFFGSLLRDWFDALLRRLV